MPAVSKKPLAIRVSFHTEGQGLGSSVAAIRVRQPLGICNSISVCAFAVISDPPVPYEMRKFTLYGFDINEEM